ncbi:hypothetical protein LEMLEM_LOCUS16211, partial [Lemmus lemmus]
GRHGWEEVRVQPGSPRANPSRRVAASLSRLAAPCSSQKSVLLSVRLELSACGGRIGAHPAGLPARALPMAPHTAGAQPCLQALPSTEHLGPRILPGVLRPLYTVPVSGVEVAERKSPLFPRKGAELPANWILLLSRQINK